MSSCLVFDEGSVKARATIAQRRGEAVFTEA